MLVFTHVLCLTLTRHCKAEVFAEVENLFKDAPDLSAAFRDFLPDVGAAHTPALRNYGWSSFHRASRRGQVEIARMLIERGADVTAQNNDGWTPLHLALVDGEVEVARMLIERGADVTAQNNDGWAPLHLALQIEEVEVARMLIERDANVAAQNNDGWTPLHLASQRGQVEVARMLIEHGADAAAQGKRTETPLHLALQWGQVDVACMLIEHGRADVTAQNNGGDTPLHLMSFWEETLLVSTQSSWAGTVPQAYAEVAPMLLKHGADINARNKKGFTPFDIASRRGIAEIVHFLVQHGAVSGAHENAN
jgi:ankyrin repeat protein